MRNKENKTHLKQKSKSKEAIKKSTFNSIKSSCCDSDSICSPRDQLRARFTGIKESQIKKNAYLQRIIQTRFDNELVSKRAPIISRRTATPMPNRPSPQTETHFKDRRYRLSYDKDYNVRCHSKSKHNKLQVLAYTPRPLFTKRNYPHKQTQKQKNNQTISFQKVKNNEAKRLKENDKNLKRKLNDKNRTLAVRNIQHNTKSLSKDRNLLKKLFEGIEFYRQLGKGTHAVVKSGVDWIRKRKIAVKTYNKEQLSKDQMDSIERQISILSSIDHPNVVKLYQIIESVKTTNLVMEYGGGNSLEQFIRSKPRGRLEENQAKVIFRQLVDCVAYLHQSGVCHRDIKPENVLLNKHLRLKLIDFGLSIRCHKGELVNVFCGTVSYMAPEVVAKLPYQPCQADCWSLGVLLYTILHGYCPFEPNHQKDIFTVIRTEMYHCENNVSENARQLIEDFLQMNPLNRISSASAMDSAWLRGA